MQPEPINTGYFLTLAGRLASRVLTRDNLHLHPDWLSHAAAARLRQGLRQLEAFLRRVLILMALALEPSLKPNLRIYEKPQTKPAKKHRRRNSFRPFPLEIPIPDWGNFVNKNSDRPRTGNTPVHAAPLLARLAALQALIRDPEARARRLAYSLARNRPGLLLAPDLGREVIPPRSGTEIFSTYRAMGRSITTQSRARPPPLPPVPRPAPRVRVL